MAEILLGLGTATLGESGGFPMIPIIQAAWPGAVLAAPAFPVRCTPGDNLAIHVAVTKAPRGSVLAVHVGDIPERGYWGEVLTTAAEEAGIKGLVIAGGARDVDALEAHEFPVFCSHIALKGATKIERGAYGQPTEVGGAPVHPGDWIVADVDGVVVIPRGQLEAVIAAGEARAAKEIELFAELRRGKTTVELLGLDASQIAGPQPLVTPKRVEIPKPPPPLPLAPKESEDDELAPEQTEEAEDADEVEDVEV